MAAADDTTGPARLWAAEEGDSLATRLAEVRDAVGIMPDLRRGVLPGLLDAVLDGEVVRSRRALRGRGGIEHPRIFIWGLLEARLQSVDVVVLGGLVETVWSRPWGRRRMTSSRHAARRRGWCCRVPCGVITRRRSRRGG
jgi:ATP-dependent helicase/nuclease subunit B